MKRKDVLNVYEAIEELSNQRTQNLRTLMKLLKIKKALEPEYQAFEELKQKAQKGFDEFLRARNELLLKCAERGEDGNPIIENGQVKLKNPAKFAEKAKELEEKYKAQLEAYNEFLEQLEELLSEEVTVLIPNKLYLEELDSFELSLSIIEKLQPVLGDKI